MYTGAVVKQIIKQIIFDFLLHIISNSFFYAFVSPFQGYWKRVWVNIFCLCYYFMSASFPSAYYRGIHEFVYFGLVTSKIATYSLLMPRGLLVSLYSTIFGWLFYFQLLFLLCIVWFYFTDSKTQQTHAMRWRRYDPRPKCPCAATDGSFRLKLSFLVGR